MNKIEKQWVLYDMGNSAFIMLAATIIPIYFKNIATVNNISNADSTAYWSYATSISTIIVAILGPILGTMGDLKGFKKPLFLFFCLLGIIGCTSLSLPLGWLAFLGIFILAKMGVSASIIFYDSMLSEITTEDRMDKISIYGYGWGYIGSCIPFTLSLLLILTSNKTGIGIQKATMFSFIITALWWAACSYPLYKNYTQKYYIQNEGHPISESISRLFATVRNVSKNKVIFSFLLAFFLYIDGVHTIISMATLYGKDMGISDSSLLLALLLIQVVAFPSVLIFAKLTTKVKSTGLISISIVGYIGVVLFAIQMDKPWEFWLLAICVAVFQGGIQALSRSYYAKIIPKNCSNEYFGLYDVFGKGASFLGILLMGIITQVSGSSSFGVLVIGILFLSGLLVFRVHLKMVK